MERTRAQTVHASIPKYLWGEVVVATAHILNMSPTSSVDDVPVNVRQNHCAGNGAHLADPSFLRVLVCRAFVHIDKHDRRKLDLTSQALIHVGYEPESKSYRLWNPATRAITVSRDVRFDETTFPLRSHDIHKIPRNDAEEIDDDELMGATTNPDQHRPSIDHPQDSSIPQSFPSPSPSPSIPVPTPPAPARPTRTTPQPERYGNVTTYAAVTAQSHDDDNPTYAMAMASTDKEHWRAAMKVEFDSLVSQSVGHLVPQPKSANVLGGMWRFKRKRDTSGNVTKYNLDG